MPAIDLGAYELPAISILALIVIGWLLWTQREERRRISAESQAERRQHTEFVENLVAKAEADRTMQMAQWREMVAQSIAAYQSLCKALQDHEERSERRFQDHERNARERTRSLVTACEGLRGGLGREGGV